MNDQYLAQRIERPFIRQFILLQKTIHERLLPTFETVIQEAGLISSEQWSKYQTEYDPDTGPDPFTASEEAEMAGVDHYLSICNVRQAIINAFLVSTHHLLEQQMLVLIRFEILHPLEEQEMPAGNIHTLFKQIFLDRYRIDLTHLTGWSECQVLRLIANTIKHTDGNSADRLRALRPDLFSSGQDFIDVTTRPSPVIRGMPAFGDNIQISPEELDKWFQHIIHFWRALACHIRSNNELLRIPF